MKISKGMIYVYRIFDVAEEIDVKQVSSLLQQEIGEEKFKVPKYIDRALIMKRPPVSFRWGETMIPFKDCLLKTELLVKIRDFGVLSLIYQIQIPENSTMDSLIQLAVFLEESSEIDKMAQTFCESLVLKIQKALKKPSYWTTFEDYIIYMIENPFGSVRELLDRPEVSRLLLAEDRVNLSEMAHRSIVDNVFQYGEGDLALIEWNSALVIEPSGGREIPDILEFAVTHLLEMRFYDELLDNKLNTLYNSIEKSKSTLFNNRFETLYEDASSRYIEFSEFIERIENSLKVVGDFYLATVYRAATKKFRLQDWKESVTRKMNILAQVTSLLQGEVNIRRSQLLEIIIVILIAYEIIIAIWK